MAKQTARGARSKGMRHAEQVDAAQARHRAGEVRENLDAFEHSESPEAERGHVREPQE
ncbi:hypothetical protein [Streptomyces sp. H39-S7]|uniref:hypothetical protein n=1 Tax=Streptomyces sp. H39-S7 TaxID=3004357 RepID=UPI0022AF8F1D|nr:hypothetical protein [Streptomyces sp. H39-S7]MCZ4117991.1 hypothetical protein [Streptomyces sp. H39-S7]